LSETRPTLTHLFCYLTRLSLRGRHLFSIDEPHECIQRACPQSAMRRVTHSLMRCIFSILGLSPAILAVSHQAPQTAVNPEASRTTHAHTAAITKLTEAVLIHGRAASSPAIVPLTTTFTPLAACVTAIYLYRFGVGGPYASLGPPSIRDCFPPGWLPDLTARFSPGLCPSGYTVACSTVGRMNDVAETTATCCPT
jgi:hypothetical protein